MSFQRIYRKKSFEIKDTSPDFQEVKKVRDNGRKSFGIIIKISYLGLSLNTYSYEISGDYWWSTSEEAKIA